MKIAVDRDKCAGLGICESLAPRYFEVDDDGALGLKHDILEDGDLSDVEDAVAGCPTEALGLVES